MSIVAVARGMPLYAGPKRMSNSKVGSREVCVRRVWAKAVERAPRRDALCRNQRGHNASKLKRIGLL